MCQWNIDFTVRYNYYYPCITSVFHNMSGDVTDGQKCREKNNEVWKFIANAKKTFMKDQFDQNEKKTRGFWLNIREISGFGKDTTQQYLIFVY